VAVAAHPRRPLVLTATRYALEQAARLLPAGECLENLVEAAIIAGTIKTTGPPKIGQAATVFLDAHQLAVQVKRTTSPLTGRKAWQPLNVVPRASVAR
jgi:hypothetical protein